LRTRSLILGDQFIFLSEIRGGMMAMHDRYHDRVQNALINGGVTTYTTLHFTGRSLR